MTATATHPGVITYPGIGVGIKGKVIASPNTVNGLVYLDDGLTQGPSIADTDATGAVQGGGLKNPIVTGITWRLLFDPFDHDLPAVELNPAANLNVSGQALHDPAIGVTTPTIVDAQVITDIRAAIALGATNDTATASFVNNSASATSTALGANYGRARGFDVRNYGWLAATTGAQYRIALRAAVAAASATTDPSEVYIPAGRYSIDIDPTDKRWVTLTKGVRLRGAGRWQTTLTIPTGTGNFSALFEAASPGTTDLSGFEMSDLTFDYNTANRPSTQAQLDAGGRTILHVGFGSDISVHDCRFVNVDSTQVLNLSGSGGLDNVTVRDNTFIIDAGATLFHDHSSIYIQGTGQAILRNTFVGNSSISARTPMETHGSGQEVAGNRVYDFMKMGNLTGVSDPSSRQIVWHDNIGRGIGLGILLYCQTYNSAVSPGLRDVDIHDNEWEIDVDKWAAILGPSTGNGACLSRTADLNAQNVNIHHNTTRVLPFTGTGLTASSNHASGIAWTRSTTGMTDTNIRITDNVIIGAVASGVEVANGGTIVGLDVSRNVVINPGLGAAAGGFSTSFTAGIFLGCTVQHARFDDNDLRDDQGTHTMAQPINLSLVAGSTHVRALDNTHHYADGATIAQVKGVTTAGLSVLARWATPVAYLAPTGNFDAGSTILDRTTGIERRQVDVQSTNWRRSKSPSTTPSVVAGAGAGTGPTVTVTGTDAGGTITVLAGTAPAAGVVAVLTYANAYAVAPVAVVCTASTTNAGTKSPAITAKGTGGFTLQVNVALAAATSYSFDYVVVTGA